MAESDGFCTLKKKAYKGRVRSVATLHRDTPRNNMDDAEYAQEHERPYQDEEHFEPGQEHGNSGEPSHVAVLDIRTMPPTTSTTSHATTSRSNTTMK